jgi:hypothetical protein
MATLTINSDYTATPNSLTISLSDGCLTIKVPSGGCLICVHAGGGRKKFAAKLMDQVDIDLTGFPSKTQWKYHVHSCETQKCPKEEILTGAHSIQIGD